MVICVSPDPVIELSSNQISEHVIAHDYSLTPESRRERYALNGLPLTDLYLA